jgi:hypothetical protein
VVYESISAIVDNIETDSGNRYGITAGYHLFNEEDPENRGLSSLVLGEYFRL